MQSVWKTTSVETSGTKLVNGGVALFFKFGWEVAGKIPSSSLIALAEVAAHQTICKPEAITCVLITGNGPTSTCRGWCLLWVSPAGPYLPSLIRSNPFKLQQDLFDRLASPFVCSLREKSDHSAFREYSGVPYFTLMWSSEMWNQIKLENFAQNLHLAFFRVFFLSDIVSWLLIRFSYFFVWFLNSFKDFFDVDHFKSLYWIYYNVVCFMCWFFGLEAYEILLPDQWSNLHPPALKGKS